MGTQSDKKAFTVNMIFLFGIIICLNLLPSYHAHAKAQDTESFLEKLSTVEEKNSKLDEFANKVTKLESEIVYLKSKGAQSCTELKQKPGFDISGEYFIDPANTGIPIKVFCDMDLEETWISHDAEELVSVKYCIGDGCFEKVFNYEASDVQIEALKAKSENCYQEITYGCKMAPLKNTRFGHYFGWWTGKDGSKKFYIDGEDEDQAVCGCHATSSCIQSMFNSTCNCDAVFLPLWATDEGKITNKESLPVRSFVYGGFISNQQEANITVGKLKCAGLRKPSENSAGSTTCSSLKHDGATQDRFYLTKEESGDTVAATYCQMSKQGYVESNLNTESYDLGGGAKIVLDIGLGSHRCHGTHYVYTACGSGKAFYKLSDPTFKSSFDQNDVHQSFNKTEAIYTI